MAEDINVLLEQCEQRAQVLSQEIDHASEEVSQIMQFATTLVRLQLLLSSDSEPQMLLELLTTL